MALTLSTIGLGLAFVFVSICLQGCQQFGVVEQKVAKTAIDTTATVRKTVKETVQRAWLDKQHKCGGLEFPVLGGKTGTVSEAYSGERPAVLCPPGTHYFGYNIVCAKSRKICLAATAADITEPHCMFAYDFIVKGTSFSTWPADAAPELVNPNLVPTATMAKLKNANTEENVREAIIQAGGGQPGTAASPIAHIITPSDLSCVAVPITPLIAAEYEDDFDMETEFTGEQSGNFLTVLPFGLCIVAGLMLLSLAYRARVATPMQVSSESEGPCE